MMRVRLSLKPGQPGTKGLLARYGKRLVCVRYRYDARTGKRFKTAEVIVGISDWKSETSPRCGDSTVALRVVGRELELRRRVKTAVGDWDPVARVWRIWRKRVDEIGMEHRIVDEPI